MCSHPFALRVYHGFHPASRQKSCERALAFDALLQLVDDAPRLQHPNHGAKGENTDYYLRLISTVILGANNSKIDDIKRRIDEMPETEIKYKDDTNNTNININDSNNNNK